MKLGKTKFDLTSNTISSGTIHVVDAWNNKVTTGTRIKLGVIGAGKTNVNQFVYSGQEYTYTLTAKEPGGE